MNKKLLTFLVSLLVIMSITLPAFAEGETRPHFVDNAGLVTSSYEASEINAKLFNLSEKNQFDIVIVTVENCEGKSATAYADDYFDYNGYGYGSDYDGCLLLVDMSDRYIYFSTSGYGETALTDWGIESIREDITPYMSDGDYEGAFKRFADLVDEYVNEAKTDKPYDVGHKKRQPLKLNAQNALIALIAALIISFIVVSSVKKSYKPVRFRSNASDYLVPGSLNLMASSDDFLYNTVSRVKIERDSSSGGSSTHTSSSGRSHGGGGGHF